MAGTEKDWQRAQRSAFIMAGVGAVIAVFAGPLSAMFEGVEAAMLRMPAIGAAVGAGSVGVLIGLKPRTKPDAAHRMKIEKRSLPLLIVSTLSFCLWFPGLVWITQAEAPSSVPLIVWLITLVSFLVGLGTMPYLWAELRAFRADPSLLDERQQSNMDKAYSAAFSGTFTFAMLGGLALSYVDVPLNNSQTAMGIGVISLFIWLVNYVWREWRDEASGG